MGIKVFVETRNNKINGDSTKKRSRDNYGEQDIQYFSKQWVIITKSAQEDASSRVTELVDTSHIQPTRAWTRNSEP